MKKIKLDPKASLSLEWSRKAYSPDLLNNFLDLTDISSGTELSNKCKRICEWYDEVITNEIYFIKDYISRELENSNEKQLIVILGACKSLLSLELLKKYADKIDRIVEIDNQWMAVKEEFYSTFYPLESDKIKCVTAELTSAEMLTSLNLLLHEYFNDIPCLILMDNISEYVSENVLVEIITSFKSPKKNNKLIMDYVLPEENISSDFKNIPLNVFELIKHESELDSINFYSKKKLNKIFSENGAEFVTDISMKEIEYQRTGKNSYFRNDNDGWVECSVWKL